MAIGISLHTLSPTYRMDCWLTVLRQKAGTNELLLRVLIEDILDRNISSNADGRVPWRYLYIITATSCLNISRVGKVRLAGLCDSSFDQ